MMTNETTLDPEDWAELRAVGHRMLDDMFDYTAGVRDRPVWQKLPDPSREELRAPLPDGPANIGDVYADFRRLVEPYATGNVHPRFMGWVHGGGNPVAMLAELLAAGLNANLGGRDHAPIEVERQVIRWTAGMLGFPGDASGLLVTGSSMANLIAVLVARTDALGEAIRRDGIGRAGLAGYTSAAAHSCLPRAFDIAGLGSSALRLIPCDASGRMDLRALTEEIGRDRAEGLRPFFVAGTAGTVETGAIDDLDAIASVAREDGLWFHVDGAFGAMAALAPSLKPLLAGIERADSVALDFHKWAQVQYDAGCIVVRDGARQLRAFAQSAAYLRREPRGLAAGHPWPCDLGPDLSRGFRALKVWMTVRVYGSARLGAMIEATCAVASRIAKRVRNEPELELLAPVTLNVVCFRFIASDGDLDRLNTDIAADLQESGVAAPSTTTLHGRIAIRAAIVNHRTRGEDADALVDGVLAAGRRRSAWGAPEHMPLS